MHFLEAALFPNALVLAGRKINFTLHPAKSADSQDDCVPPHLTVFGQNSAVSADCQVDCVPSPPLPHSVWALKQSPSLLYLFLSYLFSFA